MKGVPERGLLVVNVLSSVWDVAVREFTLANATVGMVTWARAR